MLLSIAWRKLIIRRSEVQVLEGPEIILCNIRKYGIATGRTGAMLFNTMQKTMTNGMKKIVCSFCGGGKAMRRKFYMHKSGDRDAALVMAGVAPIGRSKKAADPEPAKSKD
jgi:hypothetical protein